MKTDVTTPTVVGFLQEHQGKRFSALTIAEQTGLNPGTVTGWFSKKLSQVPISVSSVEGLRMYSYDADKVLTEQPAPKPRRRKGAARRSAVAAPRRKAGREYAEIIWRDGPNMAFILTTGELVKGVVV